ncbi:MAG: 50S ribosomal protein L25/general stress protein Ctc [Thiomicrorhabdus sp.]|jgi:large subunit ribosomal protein L25|nr:50S ribosomal protein L25/general stress protein Ctc [Thiomicrorhabdus sp.]
MSHIWTAEIRTDEGKGASRRLRHANKVPAVVYGAGKDAVSVSLTANEVKRALENPAMFNTVLTLEVEGGETETCVIKDMQRHPATGAAFHIDFQRAADNILVKKVPLTFIGDAGAPGVKTGGLMSFLQSVVEVSCVAKNLPTTINVDVSTMEEGTSMRLSEIVLPKGVSLTALSHGSSDYDQSIVNIGKAKRSK